jgi:phage tail sheath gpL-like
MAISFNNVPTTIRTPNVYLEVDNSRALQGLVQNPHKVLIIGQKITAGTKAVDTIQEITNDNLANGYFGTGSMLARMCNVFKANNPNTELHAIALSNNGGVAASTLLCFSAGMSITTAGTYYLLCNGKAVDVAMTLAWSVTDVASAIVTAVNLSTNSDIPFTATTDATSNVVFAAANSGTQGNYLDVRANYFAGQSNPLGLAVSGFTGWSGGAVDPDLDDAWAVIDGEQYQYIVQPYIDATNLTSLEGELSDRFQPLEDLQGQAFGAVRATQASATTLGNSRNSLHNCLMAANDSPNAPEEWAAAFGAVASGKLNVDPARPLHFLQLGNILPPPIANRFTRAERDILLYDGIATWITDSSDNVLIERSITTYQSNALGTPDPSYLDVQTPATLAEIRFQYKTRMQNRFIIPRFKLADDDFPVQPGTNVVTPRTIKEETIALFTLLRDIGLIENLDDFIENLVVERNTSDVNRVDVLLPPDLINQFRVLAGLVQFIL